MAKSNPSHTVIVKMRNQGGPEYVGVDENFMASADQALTIHDIHFSYENRKRALYGGYDFILRRSWGHEETWSPADEEPRPIPYIESKTYWSSYCFKSPLDVQGTKGPPSAYLLSLCSPRTILISFGLWNYTAFRSNSIQSSGTLCYNYHLPITSPTTWSSGCPLHLPTSHKVSPLQEQPPPQLPACSSSRLSRSP